MSVESPSLLPTLHYKILVVQMWLPSHNAQALFGTQFLSRKRNNKKTSLSLKDSLLNPIKNTKQGGEIILSIMVHRSGFSFHNIGP